MRRFLLNSAAIVAMTGQALAQPAPIFPYTQDPNTGAVTFRVPVNIPDLIPGASVLAFNDADGKPARCNGTFDDSVAIAAWLAFGALGNAISLPNASCAFATPLAAANPNNMTISGLGPASNLNYIGATNNVDAITLGSTSGAITYNLTLQNFSVTSATAMVSPSTGLHIEATRFPFVNNVQVDNLYGNGNLWNGIWFDQVDNGTWINGAGFGHGDVFRLNGKAGGFALKGEFKLLATRLRGVGSSSVAIHVGGAFGGFACDAYTSTDVAETNILIDAALVAESNREIFLRNCLTDSALQDNVDVNDNASPGGGTIEIFGEHVGAVRYGINVSHWTNGWLTIEDGSVSNNGGDNIRLSDTSANYIIGPQKNVSSGGFGINCTVSIPAGLVNLQPGGTMTANASGNVASNCNAKTILQGNETISGPSGILLNGAVATTAWAIGNGTSPTLSIANGASAALTTGSGSILVINENNGDAGLYLCGGAHCTLVSTTLATWVTPTITPAAGKASVNWDGSASYQVYNNIGSTQSIHVTGVQGRNAD